MTDRITYRQRVATVRGRARAQLAALRKERLARVRTGDYPPETVSAAAWLADAAADGRRDTAPAAEFADRGAPGGDSRILRVVEEAPEPDAVTSFDGIAEGETSDGPLLGADHVEPLSEEPVPEAVAVSADAAPDEPEGVVATAPSEDLPPDPDSLAAEQQPVAVEEPPADDMQLDAGSPDDAVADTGPLVLEPAALTPEYRSERAAEAPEAAQAASDAEESVPEGAVLAAPDARADAEAVISPSDMSVAAVDLTAEGPHSPGTALDVPVHADDGSTELDIHAAAAGSDPVHDAVPAASADIDPAANSGKSPPDRAADDGGDHEAAALEEPTGNDPAPEASVAAASEERTAHSGDQGVRDQPPVPAAREDIACENAHDHEAGVARGAPACPPERSVTPPSSDLPDIPGVGPGLVWMLESAGVRTLEDLARAEPRDLAARLGSISRLLDLDYLIDYARDRGKR